MHGWRVIRCYSSSTPYSEVVAVGGGGGDMNGRRDGWVKLMEKYSVLRNSKSRYEAGCSFLLVVVGLWTTKS